MTTNFDLQRELAEQSPDDWQFGAASQPSLVTIPESERDSYLPKGELQFDSKADFTDCASRSPVNHLEALFTYHYRHGMKPENKKWLEEKGYIQDNKVTFSDRYIAKLSGTTRTGNSLKSPADAIYRYGLVPKKLLPKEEWMGWDDYYAPIPQNLLDLGQEFRKRFTLNYEQVPRSRFDEVLKSDMLGVAGYAWPPPVKEVYPKTEGMQFNHAFLIFKHPQWQIFDNYYDDGAIGDFTKTLAPDYIFFDYGYRMYLSAENVPTTSTTHVFSKNLAYGMTDPEVAELQKALVSLDYKIAHAITDQYLSETQNAVFRFQRDMGIGGDDGSHFGPKTRLALNKALNPGVPFGGDVWTFVQSFFSGT